MDSGWSSPTPENAVGAAALGQPMRTETAAHGGTRQRRRSRRYHAGCTGRSGCTMSHGQGRHRPGWRGVHAGLAAVEGRDGEAGGDQAEARVERARRQRRSQQRVGCRRGREALARRAGDPTARHERRRQARGALLPLAPKILDPERRAGDNEDGRVVGGDTPVLRSVRRLCVGHEAVEHLSLDSAGPAEGSVMPATTVIQVQAAEMPSAKHGACKHDFRARSRVTSRWRSRAPTPAESAGSSHGGGPAR